MYQTKRQFQNKLKTMIRKLKQTNTKLLEGIPPEIGTISSKEIVKKDFNSNKSQKLILNKRYFNNMLYKFSDEFALVKSNEDYMQQFSMLYFDTPQLKMYFEHHNRSASRYQVYRKYKYNNEKSQLIVKSSDNKNNRNKKKFRTSDFEARIPLKYFDYIDKNTNHPAFQLKPVLNCDFNRYVFTNKSNDLLITIDADLSFWNDYKTNYLPDLAVATIKTKNYSPQREIANALKLAPGFPSGLNKFSIGMALTNPDLKQNMLKQKIYNLKRISNDY